MMVPRAALTAMVINWRLRQFGLGAPFPRPLSAPLANPLMALLTKFGYGIELARAPRLTKPCTKLCWEMRLAWLVIGDSKKALGVQQVIQHSTEQPAP